ncbi:hypothetical protein C8Q79DRAFT_782661 [Trametes meyenii]|nr:hypothetical protein C8Q79DRAFT_782661 [Trametes meyenii]
MSSIVVSMWPSRAYRPSTPLARLRTVAGCRSTRPRSQPRSTLVYSGGLDQSQQTNRSTGTRNSSPSSKWCSIAEPNPRCEDAPENLKLIQATNGKMSNPGVPKLGSREPSDDRACSGRLGGITQENQGEHPSLIIIFGWLGAKPSHLRKYSEAYRRLCPSSSQLIINSDPLRFWKPLAVRERALEKAVQDIESHFSDVQRGTPPRIMMHIMSNGGACSLVDLASRLRKKGVQAPAGTKCAVIFDSSPAPVTFAIMNRAFTAGIRGRLRRYFAMLLVSTIYVITLVVRAALRLPAKPMERELALLNDSSLLPWTSARTPRMYLYSSGDRIVPAPGVEEHAARARMAGFPVRMVHFGQSGHVAHARDDPEKYWGAVRSFWEEASR